MLGFFERLRRGFGDDRSAGDRAIGETVDRHIVAALVREPCALQTRRDAIVRVVFAEFLQVA